MPKVPKIVAIIPARWDSTRFPGKPLHLIAGKPLIQHVWERCRSASALDEIVIATDDVRIAEAAFAFGAEVSLTAKSHRSGTDRIAEVAKKMRDATHILNVQGDEPVVDPRLINRLAKTLVSENLAMITAANPFANDEPIENPNAVKVVLDRNGDALYFSRSAIPFDRDKKAAQPYFRHQGIYGYSRKFLLQFVQWRPSPLEKTEQLEQLRALENDAKIRVLITKKSSIGVDTPEDAESLEKSLTTISEKS